MADEQQVSKEEKIGFHKGSLATLAKEREELVRIVGITEQLIQMHMSSLKEMGVDLDEQAQAATQQQPDKKKPIEDIL